MLSCMGTSFNESTVGSVKLYDMKLSGSSISLQKVVVANKSSKSIKWLPLKSSSAALPIASAELTTKYNSQVISLLHRNAFQVSHNSRTKHYFAITRTLLLALPEQPRRTVTHTHTHTHTNTLPYTSIAHAHRGIITDQAVLGQYYYYGLCCRPGHAVL